MRNDQSGLPSLVEQLKSGNQTLRDKALEQLRKTGWLYDASLKEIDLNGVDLSGANLANASLVRQLAKDSG